MVALTSLKIQENQLSCYLPSELGLLTSAGGLSNFLISDNIFEGSIPSELGDLVPTSGFIVYAAHLRAPPCVAVQCIGAPCT